MHLPSIVEYTTEECIGYIQKPAKLFILSVISFVGHVENDIPVVYLTIRYLLPQASWNYEEKKGGNEQDIWSKKGL